MYSAPTLIMTTFWFFIRVVRSSVADGDESGSPCGYEVRCLAADPCSGILCCADSFYSAGHGGTLCFSPCYTTSLVHSFFSIYHFSIYWLV